MTLVSTEQPIHVNRAVEVRAGFELAHDRDDAGDVTRLFMNVWTEVRGAAGRISPNSKPGRARARRPPVRRAHVHAPARAARSAQGHAPRGRGLSERPDAHPPPPAPATAQEPPDGARWLDELAPDTAPTTTSRSIRPTRTSTSTRWSTSGCSSTRSIAGSPRAGRRGKLRSRAVDIAYRKPSFAGDRVRAQLRLYEGPDGLGAAGFIAGDDGKPRVYVRVAIAR